MLAEVTETLKGMEATVKDTLELALGSTAIQEAEVALAMAVATSRRLHIASKIEIKKFTGK